MYIFESAPLEMLHIRDGSWKPNGQTAAAKEALLGMSARRAESAYKALWFDAGDLHPAKRNEQEDYTILYGYKTKANIFFQMRNKLLHLPASRIRWQA